MPVSKQISVELDPSITELDDINPTRIDQVGLPASGIPVLFMKSIDVSKAVNPAGGIDEKPDIDGAESILQLLAGLIQSEAAEMKIGSWDEAYDIQLLSEIASLVRCFRDREMWGDEDDGTVQKAQDDFAKEVYEVFIKAHRKFSSADRKSLAAQGHALPDGSYPIPDADALRRAAILARSGHGDVAAAKRLIAKRAKELGVGNPLAGEAAKSVPTQMDGYGPGATEDPKTSAEDPETADGEDEPTAGDPNGETVVSKAQQDVLKAVITEAIAPVWTAIESIQGDMAKVLNTAIPGGPAITAPPAARAVRTRDELLSKAARAERLADTVREPDLVNFYKAEAVQARLDAAAL